MEQTSVLVLRTQGHDPRGSLSVSERHLQTYINWCSDALFLDGSAGVVVTPKELLSSTFQQYIYCWKHSGKIWPNMTKEPHQGPNLDCPPQPGHIVCRLSQCGVSSTHPVTALRLMVARLSDTLPHCVFVLTLYWTVSGPLRPTRLIIYFTGSTRPVLYPPPHGCHPPPAINQVRSKVNPPQGWVTSHGKCHLPTDVPPPQKVTAPHDAPPPHWCATPHRKCHLPLTCHTPILLAVVYGDGWRQRSTLAFGATSLVFMSGEKKWSWLATSNGLKIIIQHIFSPHSHEARPKWIKSEDQLFMFKEHANCIKSGESWG